MRRTYLMITPTENRKVSMGEIATILRQAGKPSSYGEVKKAIDLCKKVRYEGEYVYFDKIYIGDMDREEDE